MKKYKGMKQIIMETIDFFVGYITVRNICPN